jgi:hypothetical protein
MHQALEAPTLDVALSIFPEACRWDATMNDLRELLPYVDPQPAGGQELVPPTQPPTTQSPLTI